MAASKLEWITKIRGSLLPFIISRYVKNKSFANDWTTTTLREGRDMDKDFRPTLCWCDKAEATIIIPLGELTFNTHNKRSIEKLICCIARG